MCDKKKLMNINFLLTFNWYAVWCRQLNSRKFIVRLFFSNTKNDFGFYTIILYYICHRFLQKYLENNGLIDDVYYSLELYGNLYILARESQSKDIGILHRKLPDNGLLLKPVVNIKILVFKKIGGLENLVEYCLFFSLKLTLWVLMIIIWFKTA